MTPATLPPALALRPRDQALSAFGRLIEEAKAAEVRARAELEQLTTGEQGMRRMQQNLGMLRSRIRRLRAGRAVLLLEGEAS